MKGTGQGPLAQFFFLLLLAHTSDSFSSGQKGVWKPGISSEYLILIESFYTPKMFAQVRVLCCSSQAMT